MRRGARVLTVGLSLMSVVACADDGQTQHATAEINGMVNRYLDALRNGDIDAAMGERCTEARITDPSEVETFRVQADDVVRMSSIERIEVRDATTSVAPLQGAKDVVQFDYVVVMTDRTSERLHGVAIRQDGALKWCGYAQPDVDATHAALLALTTPGDEYTGELAMLMPTAIAADFTVNDDQAFTPEGEVDSFTADDGAVEGWSKGFRREGYGGARVTAYRFERVADVDVWFRSRADQHASNVSDRFDSGQPDSVATRYACDTWTWVQAPGESYQCDRVYIRLGTTIVQIDITGLQPDADHSIAVDVARTVSAAAANS